MTPELENGLFGVAGAAIGALLTGAFAWRQARAFSSRHELTITSTRVSRLLEVDTTISKAVEIRIHGKLVPSIYTAVVNVVNSGTQYLEDVGAWALIEGSSDIISAEIVQRPAGIEPSGLSLSASEKRVELRASYLNVGESVSLRLLLSDKPERIKVGHRQKGVAVVIREDLDPTNPGAVGRILFESIRNSSVLFHLVMLIAAPQYRQFWKSADRPAN